MKDSIRPDPLRGRFDGAPTELQKILSEAERQHLRRLRVAKLVESLNNRFGFDAQLVTDRFIRTDKRPGLTLTTRFAVVKVTRNRAK
ncbi:MAG TPA: hypothetical protein VMU48_06280 [Terracidiphilus sp.]|nr:hypothetical protein [Terracidiphilus sp.]